MTLNDVAEAYVKLVLATGQHDPGYVDAYYGPPEWQADSQKLPLAELLEQAEELTKQAHALPPAVAGQELRQDFLRLHVAALRTYIAHLSGTTLSFNEESLALYDARSPDLSPADFEPILAELDQLLPGDGDLDGDLNSLNTRLSSYNKQFEIPQDKLDAVFSAAINEARARTRKHISLPEEESFRVEYVKDQVWSAYNWYKGNSYSLIQVNTDFPMFISRAIDLASHEGYPGHHVFNLLIEKHLVNENGWVEYSIYPLYSPMSFLAEGSANYGIEVAFPHAERMAFEKAQLFPLAGIDPAKVDHYYQVQAVLQKLSYAGNMVAQLYLDGDIDTEAAVTMLMKYALSDEARSRQRLRFMERHRSYVINYNLGQDMTRAYVERLAQPGNEGSHWQVFAELLAKPKTASMMK
ncbi:hypothetical protein H8L32_24120 [Undibacterium sp. CY18W]|uniref:DUF885 domain-containing protein n=1 Tax=Undibacterium hunanense TaxID=2762292 RepID=A0ABR6ZY35_9BURK|nr:hypothetical protein [Undibacterium hunanense]MBC3920573.1 hypothetical protein [Undibacterium hunanense]